ncbi:MAG: SpaH/EbpB family LPXTG-anchored major pilin [Oscillospiraceae bacterium]|nr:SpaH/EbpB family LPXTG-anchored major pilin [Oscillospiraceae bacterium]
MKTRKILATLLALFLFLATALPISVSAAGTGSITILPPENGSLTINDTITFNAYKLFAITNVLGNGDDEPFEFVYEATAKLMTFLQSLDALTLENVYDVEADPTTHPALAASEFRAWLANSTEPQRIALAKALNGLSGHDYTTVGHTANNKAVLENVDYGYYLVTGEGDPVDPLGAHSGNVFSRNMLVNVPEVKTVSGLDELDDDVDVHLKADAPKIDKEVWFHGNTDDMPYDNEVSENPAAGDSGWQKWTDVSIGDTVFFKHISTVPDTTGYTDYVFKVHDIMSPGLTYAGNSEMKIYLTKSGQASQLLAYTTDYTVSSNSNYNDEAVGGYGAGSTKIEITFVTSATKFLNSAGWTIEIIYQALLNEKALIAPDGNPNRVWLQYSNKPYDTTTNNTPEDEAIVYTFDLEIYKHTGDIGDPSPLGGAEFELYPKVDMDESDPVFGAAIEFIALQSADDGEPHYDATYNYRVAKPGESGRSATLVSGADGFIRIKGLDAGEYELVETKAPPGYNGGWRTSILIEHVDTTPRGQKQLHVTIAGVAEEEQSVNVQNRAGGLLPGTGGIGVKIIYAAGIAGAIALAGYIVFLIYRRRRNLLSAAA